MAGRHLLQSRLLPPDAVVLGRLVVDIQNPQRRYHDPFSSEALSSTKQTEHSVIEASQRLRSTRVRLALTELLTTFQTRRQTHGSYLQTVAAITYALNQWDETFGRACSQEDTRRWLEEAIEDGKDVYFIVGYRAFVDPETTEFAQVGKGDEQSVQLPVSSVAEANLPGVQISGVLDPSVSYYRARDEVASRSFRLGGECVYAVQYCKVKFKWFSSQQIKSSSLGENKWRVYMGIRGDDEDDEGVADVVEASVTEEWQCDETIFELE